ncbi:ricin-type beta-trefoil lectin domain protein [Rhodococcus sp. X156]|uniref:ricin-type beta-trefoil lectin domain protein n=1 Tax=Rhodococcus sp. X156 TaxID=2499145 RepID=UPI000FDB84D2|nr:ricin-type beta-trefoil lectin domain protein [Rhodococcus sp. X156]
MTHPHPPVRRARSLRQRLITDDRGSMPMALLVILVGISFGALLLPMVITQTQSTRLVTSRVQALHAAQSGLEVATGLIRSAADTSPTATTGAGDPRKLPCGPLAGPVGDGGQATYSVDIAYYAADPYGHDDAWLADPRNKMICVSGYGVYLKASGTTPDLYVPSYALLTATGINPPGGAGSSPGRTLQATYVFQTSNAYTAAGGGSISFGRADGTEPFCMGVDKLQEGAAVVAKNCYDNSADAVKMRSWYYNVDLSLQLVQTKNDAAINTNLNGLCLHQGSPTIVRKCAAKSDATPTTGQEWRSDAVGRFLSASGSCLTLPTLALKAAFTTTGCGNGSQAYTAQPTVGAGAAGLGSKQLVNFGDFGRCLDVPNKDAAGDGSSFMIIYPCKQKLDLVDEWNQKFTPSTTINATKPTQVQWRTTPPNSSAYCLKSPRADKQAVTVARCATNDPGQTWTYYTTQAADGTELAYGDKFTIRDSANPGLCLGEGPARYDSSPPSYKVIVSACDGSPLQKWNSDPNVRASRVENTAELPFQAP